MVITIKAGVHIFQNYMVFDELWEKIENGTSIGNFLFFLLLLPKYFWGKSDKNI